MAEVLKVEDRAELGKLHTRRLRRAGRIPVVLYGHGEGTVHLSVAEEEVAKAIRHGARLVELQGARSDTALIHEAQWDTFAQDVLHLDLMRVSAGERIEVEVPIETRGVAPGTREGGVLKQVIHEVALETIPSEIPEKLSLNINELQLNGELTASDLEGVPQQAKLLIEPDAVIIQCTPPVEEEEEEAEAGPAEPEVVGRKEGEEEGESSAD